MLGSVAVQIGQFESTHFLMTYRYFPAFQNLGPGALDFGKKIARKSIKLGKSDRKFKAICKYFGLPLTCSTIYFFIVLVVNRIYYN